MTCRKIPGMNTYTAGQPDKEQEVIPTVTSIDVPNPEGGSLTSLDHVDTQLNSKNRGTDVLRFCLKQRGLFPSSRWTVKASSFSVKICFLPAFKIEWSIISDFFLLFGV